MGGDEEERRAKEDKGHAHSSFGLDLGDDPGGDSGMLHFCAGQRKYRQNLRRNGLYTHKSSSIEK